MTLDDVILHPRSKELAEKLASHLPQGLIVDGPSGIGVVTVAKALAQAIGSPAFITLPKKKIKNEFVVDLKEGSVIIDDIRALYQQTRTKQPEAQVYIIDTGEKSMTHGAQNAFLKLLEEPRDGVHFIIATHHFDQLLPTIASRSQRLSLLPVTTEQTADLINQLDIKDETARTRMAFVGNGLPGLVKRLAEDDSLYESRIAIMRDAKAMLGNDVYEKLTVIHRYRESRNDALTLIDDMNHQLRIILRSQPNQQLVSSVDRYLSIRSRIAAGGNIRLHLTSGVL